MAKKKSRPDPASASEGGGFDMTPMIDVTFLLIIFFMCVTEMSDAAKSLLLLPISQNGEVDDKPDPGRMVINVLKDGKVEINRQPYNDAQLMTVLNSHYQLSAEAGSKISNKTILIRVDEQTEYVHVQKVMAFCMLNKFWKLAFASRNPNAQH